MHDNMIISINGARTPQTFSTTDSAVVGCISYGHEKEYTTLVGGFVEWSGRNNLLMNVNKTREMTSEGRGQLHNPCLSWRRMLIWWKSTSTWASTSTTGWKTSAVYKLRLHTRTR